MIRTRNVSKPVANRKLLRSRVAQMHESLNGREWEKCFQLIDPKLRDTGKVSLSDYSEGLREFMDAFGSVRPWHMRISLHLDGSKNKHDPRPFAYVYTVWQDERHEFHMFRDRWVKHGGRWYTRVAGLVANRQNAANS